MTEPTPEELKAQIAALERQLALAQSQQSTQVSGSGSIAQEGGIAAGAQGVAAGQVGRDVVIVQEGGTVVYGEAPVKMTAVDRESALGRYLQHIISRNRYLAAPGHPLRRQAGQHRAGPHLYPPARRPPARVDAEDERWLAREAALAPGERSRRPQEIARRATETVTVSVEEALARARGAWWCWATPAAARPPCCATWPCSTPATWPKDTAAGAGAAGAGRAGQPAHPAAPAPDRRLPARRSTARRRHRGPRPAAATSCCAPWRTSASRCPRISSTRG